jgi:hypothetical protein
MLGALCVTLYQELARRIQQGGYPACCDVPAPVLLQVLAVATTRELYDHTGNSSRALMRRRMVITISFNQNCG